MYAGQTLYKLVGKVDDGDPTSFNRAKAKAGYKIRFICADGYRETHHRSRRIIGKTTGSSRRRRRASCCPMARRPIRFVGSFIEPFNGKLSARQIYKIRLIF